MFAAAAGPLFDILILKGVDSWCTADKDSPKKGLTYWSIYIFYLSKFYELIDTLILVARKVPILIETTQFLAHIPSYYSYFGLLVVGRVQSNFCDTSSCSKRVRTHFHVLVLFPI